MTTKSKNGLNQSGGLQVISRERPYSDEGTEVDLRWAFRAAEFSNADTPATRGLEKLLLTQVSEQILSRWGADTFDSAVAGSIPW